jgi:hypothetical protein
MAHEQRDPFDLDRIYARRGWEPYGSTPDVRPPYFASYGPDDYDPSANWAAARRPSWGVRSTRGIGGYGMEGSASVNRVGGYGPEGGYGEFGDYRTARVVAGGAGSLGQSHAGRGPKNYRRPDASIAEDVSEALTLDPDVDASEIDVHVEGGEVTLTGSVHDRRSKRRAEDDAAACSGVRDVHNRLRIAT